MVGSDKSKSKYSILSVCWFMLGIMVITTTFAAAPEECETDLRGLEIECMYYMHKGEPPTLMNPNHRCCDVIQHANLPCCCRNLNRKLFYPPGYTIEDMLDWEKVLHCLNFCGKPLDVGTNCGSFTVP